MFCITSDSWLHTDDLAVLTCEPSKTCILSAVCCKSLLFFAINSEQNESDSAKKSSRMRLAFELCIHEQPFQSGSCFFSSVPPCQVQCNRNAYNTVATRYFMWYFAVHLEMRMYHNRSSQGLGKKGSFRNGNTEYIY